MTGTTTTTTPTTTEFFLARTHVEASLRDGLIIHGDTDTISPGDTLIQKKRKVLIIRTCQQKKA